MKFRGSDVYDDADFFRKYSEKRQRGDSPNDTLEKPIIDELAGALSGKTILDVGCGDGAYGKELLERGAAFYHGIDGSENMIRLAKANTKSMAAKIEKISVENFVFPAQAYDLVLSRLVLHYLADLAPVLSGIRQSLRDHGKAILSVEHPIITSCYDAYHQGSKRSSWLVDHYFDSGERINHWIGKDVVKYHRTIEEYFELCQQAGFRITAIREAKPQPQYFAKAREYERRKKIPLFLILLLELMID